MNKRPTGIIFKNILDNLGLSITDAAKILKVMRAHASNLANGKISITPEMAVRLEKAFNTRARKWLEIQLDYELELARKKKYNIQRFSNKRIKIEWPKD